MKYDFTAIEHKWQKIWEEQKPYAAVTGDTTREKFYGLIEFPYPSGQGLHVGHPRPFTAMDIICRKKRMQGYNVLYPYRLRRLRPADGELCHQEPYPSGHRDEEQHRELHASSCRCWATPSTGTA